MRRRESAVWRGAPRRFLVALTVLAVLCVGAVVSDDGGGGGAASVASNDSESDEADDEEASETVTLDMEIKPGFRDHLWNGFVVMLFLLSTRPLLLMYARCLASALPVATNATKIQLAASRAN